MTSNIISKRIQGGHHEWETIHMEGDLHVYKTTYEHNGNSVTEIVTIHIEPATHEQNPERRP